MVKPISLAYLIDSREIDMNLCEFLQACLYLSVSCNLLYVLHAEQTHSYSNDVQYSAIFGQSRWNYFWVQATQTHKEKRREREREKPGKRNSFFSSDLRCWFKSSS